MARRLHRSRKDRMLCGVLGGLAEYFDIDTTLVRVIFVLIVLATGGAGIIAYLIMAIVFPVEGTPETTPTNETIKQNVQDMKETAESIAGGLKAGLKREPLEKSKHRQGFIAGAILVVLGIIFLMANFGFLQWLTWGKIWPLLLIVIGVLLIVGMFRRRR